MALHHIPGAFQPPQLSAHTAFEVERQPRLLYIGDWVLPRVARQFIDMAHRQRYD